MQGQSLTELGEEQLAMAREASSGRAGFTIFGGHEHDLRQTLIALVEGRALGEHDAPGEASLLVLRGRVRLSTEDDSWVGSSGDYVVIQPSREELLAETDAVVLLTVASRASVGR
jgi:quercetin dioxygenase-like cupin family protein